MAEVAVVTTREVEVELKKYRLKAGCEHFVSRLDENSGQLLLEEIKPGVELDLTKTQAEAFGDKFEAVDASPFTKKKVAMRSVTMKTVAEKI